MAEPLKFLHAADLHLDDPISGLADLPPHLKSALAAAPFTAAQRLFDLAIAERVDFLLLAGDVMDVETAGPRATAFVLSQFERLAEKDISIYWSGGSIDHPDRWPRAIRLPQNVVAFSAAVPESIEHVRGGTAIATICGAGRDVKRRTAAEFRVPDQSAFPIAMVHGEIDPGSVLASPIRYWALGGDHARRLTENPDQTIAIAGTLQARRPEETGMHGCWLVRADGGGKVRTAAVDLDTVRWCAESLSISESTKLDELKQLLGDRCRQLRGESPEIVQLVRWRLAPSGEFHARLRSAAWHDELLQWVRLEFGQGSPCLWTDTLEIDPPSRLPAGWFDEDTLLGDYLRAVSELQGLPQHPLNLKRWVAQSEHDPWLDDLDRLQGAERDRVLQSAVLAGLERLGSDRHKGE